MKIINRKNSQFKNLIKFSFAGLILKPLSIFLSFIPRNDKIWLFGNLGGYGYGDNAKWLFRWCIDNGSKDIKYIWISKDKKIVSSINSNGMLAYYAYSFKGIMYCIVSKVYIFTQTSSDINFWTSQGACLINLWHGSPLKNIMYDVDNKGSVEYIVTRSIGLKKIYYQFCYPGFFEKPSILCATSEQMAERMSSAFQLDRLFVKVTGYPRNDLLKMDKRPDEYPDIIDKFDFEKKIIVYLPTYRERTEGMDLQELLNKLHDLPIQLVIKLHPFDKSVIDASFQNVLFLSSNVDIYPLLPYCDALITDYSSISYDFMILNRPIIYFVPDLEGYLKNDRGLYEPFESAAGGSIEFNLEGLKNTIESEVILNKQATQEKRRLVSNRYNFFNDSHSSFRVYKQIMGLL